MHELVFEVNFNEMLEPDLVLLSATDEINDINGQVHVLHEGLKVNIYMADVDSAGNVDDLVASGVVEKNNTLVSWALHVKWCCRIDMNGIRHQSES